MYTISVTTYLVRSDSTGRESIGNPSKGVGSLDKSSVLELSVATGTTSTPSFGGVTTAKVVHITSDEDVTLKFNGDSTGIVLKANGMMTLTDVEVDELAVTNTSGSEANVVIKLYGV